MMPVPSARIDESTPLLPAVDAQKDVCKTPTPLPKAQLAILCAIRLMDPITFTQIFPYINEFLISLNLVQDKSQIGLYSGLVESSFALFQLLFIYQWAWISDMAGRRPVVIIGTAGLSMSTMLLGLTSSLPQILVARCLAGAFSGTAAVLHSILGELTDQSNQALAFPIYGLFWPLGNILGPLIGGTLANPADKYPRIFGSFSFFTHYPYFLPCFFSGFLALLTALQAYFFFRESLPNDNERLHGTNSKVDTEMDSPVSRPSTPQLSSSTSKPSNLSVSPLAHAEPRSHWKSPECSGRVCRRKDYLAQLPHSAVQGMTMRGLFSIPIIEALCLSGCALCFVATAFDALFVLFCYTPIELGGLSFNTSQIGYALAIAGAISIFIQLTLLPALLREFPPAKLYNCFMCFWPLVYALLPILHITVTFGSGFGSNNVALVWTEIVVLLALSRIGCLAYSMSLILCKEHAPAPTALAKANGLVLVGMCIARAIAPAFVSSMFAWSLRYQGFGGYLWVLVMVSICLLGCLLSKRVARLQGA